MPFGSVRGASVKTARSRVLLGLVIVILTVGLAGVWSVIAQRQLATSLHNEQTARFASAREAFKMSRARTQANLQEHGRVLVEDPRLKSTLATENMDAATVDDILNDLGKLRGTGFLMVLSPEGRVFAESNAKELRGLDLSASSIVKAAQGSPEAAVGSWVIGDKVMDLSIIAMRFDANIIAYLVVGQSIEDTDLQVASTQCACETATALGTKISTSISKNTNANTLFTIMASEPGVSEGSIRRVSNEGFLTSAYELGDVAQSHRLLLAAPVISASVPFERLKLLLWVPPALVLLAVLFALSANRSPRRKM